MILNGRTLIEVLPLIDLYTVHKGHDRLRVFANKGRECVICEREGVLLLVTVDKGGGTHVDLYTEDFVLMTVDHIVPSSIARELGWSKKDREALDNKQPMCDPCNNKKGNKYILNEEFKKRRLRHGYPHKHKGVAVIYSLVHNEGIFNRNLEGLDENLPSRYSVRAGRVHNYQS